MRVGLSVAMSAVCIAGCVSNASQRGIEQAVYGAYDARQFSSSPVSGSLSGGKLGYEVRQTNARLGGLLEAGCLIAGTGGLSIFSFGAGGRISALRRDTFELGVQAQIELQGVRLDRFQNANILFAGGVGFYGEARVATSVALTLALTASAFADATSPTTCNDGSTSESTGSGTCSGHDGVAYYNDMLGNGTFLDASFGLAVWFGR